MVMPILFIIALLVLIFAVLSVARSVRKVALNSEGLLPNLTTTEHYVDFRKSQKDQRLDS